MVAILDVLVLVGLIAFNIVLLGSYRFDLRQINRRLEELEAQGPQSMVIADTSSAPEPPVYEPYEAWLRVNEDIDREIIRARERNRS